MTLSDLECLQGHSRSNKNKFNIRCVYTMCMLVTWRRRLLEYYKYEYFQCQDATTRRFSATAELLVQARSQPSDSRGGGPFPQILDLFQGLKIGVPSACLRETDFYRATRMHSAEYAVARCLSVCPSVHPSVTRQYCV